MATNIFPIIMIFGSISCLLPKMSALKPIGFTGVWGASIHGLPINKIKLHTTTHSGYKNAQISPAIISHGVILSPAEDKLTNDSLVKKEAINKIVNRVNNFKEAIISQSVIVDIIKAIGRDRRATADIFETPPVYNVWNYSSCDPLAEF